MGKKNEFQVIRMVKQFYPGICKKYWENDFRKFNQQHSSVYFILLIFKVHKSWSLESNVLTTDE